jgi:hypothetical protein
MLSQNSFLTGQLSAPCWFVGATTGGADQTMLAAARLAMDLALPAEEAGQNALLDPQHLVIDTKFTSVLGRGWYREQSLRAGYVYQL